MKDDQIYDYFKQNSSIFNEMPTENLWNEINKSLNKKSKNQILKKYLILASGLIATLFFYFYFMNKTVKPILKTNEAEKINDAILISTEKETFLPLEDTTKKKKVFKNLNTIKIAEIKSISPQVPIQQPKLDIILPKEMMKQDSLKYIPQILANRYLFESDKIFTAEEFTTYVKEVLDENKLNYGKLIVIKAKGHIPFRKLIPKKDIIPKPIKHQNEGFIVRSVIFINDSVNTKRDSIKK